MPTEPHDFTKKPIHVSSNNVKFAVVAVKLPAPPAVIVVDAFVAMLKSAFNKFVPDAHVKPAAPVCVLVEIPITVAAPVSTVFKLALKPKTLSLNGTLKYTAATDDEAVKVDVSPDNAIIADIGYPVYAEVL